MAKSVRSLRSKLLFNGGSPNSIRSLVFLTRSSSHSVAEVSTTATISPERDQIAASSEQPLRSLSFNDGRNAFRSKTTWEIIRALAIFRLCSFDFLVNRNKELLHLGQKVLGKHLFRRLLKASFYGHFVAGEDQEAIKPVISNLEKFGVGAILDYSVEEDLSENETKGQMGNNPDESLDPADEHAQYKPHVEFADRRKGVYSARTYFYEGEEECDTRLNTFLKCIDAAGGASKDGFAAIKVTALGRPQILMRISEILNQTQYFFDHLASDSVTMDKIGNSVARDKFFEGLERLGVEMSPEEANRIFDLIDTNKSGDIDVIEWHEFLTPQLKLSQLFKAKPKGDVSLPAYEFSSSIWKTIGKHCVHKALCLQVPSQDTYSKIQTDMELARREGYMFGAKLVRGAYMEQERLRASTLGYTDPIHPSYKATSKCFDEVLNAVLEETKRGNANVLVATHNENSIQVAIKRMHELGISPQERKVFFGQLLGMSDAISFTLGNKGYAVYKYVPFGPVDEVLPYLSRRAMENKGLLKGVLKERGLLWGELRRRFQEGELKYDPTLVQVGST
ncbi:proline dehydrogenase 1, mitochondrial-like [Orbicella faveolata]|uniref:proline dehydrogenase 1, mitochondrial-like n=1 Tax=Orbicella faveolata TaxID=48498 RepID=UPI0009E3503E|nr:proline dehydrogenase 1, mitochondrial-like [Orbicella faveolata]